MERLCKEDRKDLVWAMRKSLLEQVGSGVLTESADAAAKNFILNEATYEQLLNLCFNENREEKYLPSSILEQVAVGVYKQYVEEDFRTSKLEDRIAAEKKAAGAAEKGIKGKVKRIKDAVTAGAKKGAEATTAAVKKGKSSVFGAIKRHPYIAAGTGTGLVATGTAAALYKRSKKKKAAEKAA